MFDRHSNDCFCGASGKSYHNLFETYDWWWSLICGRYPGYVTEAVNSCVALVPLWTAIFWQLFVSATTLREEYIYCSWGSTYSVFFVLSHSVAHTERANKNNCSLGVDVVSPEEWRWHPFLNATVYAYMCMFVHGSVLLIASPLS